MANGFSVSQQKTLRQILKANASTSVYSQLNLGKLGAYRDFELLYQAFTRATPVQSPRAFVDGLGKLLQPPGQNALQILQSPNLVMRGRPLAATLFRGQPLPVDGQVVEDFLSVEGKLRDQLKAQGIAVSGSFYYLNDLEPQMVSSGQLPLKGWHQLIDAGRSWFRRRWTLPRTAAMPNAGNSRFQWFSAQLDQLKNVGKQVEVLVASPKTLLDFSLYVSQQEGRFVPLAQWCPNLKVLAFNSHDVALQRTELGYLLAGLPEVKWMQWFYQPAGLVAWQADINIRQRLAVLEDGHVFYEFVPVEDVLPDGRFTRNYRRHHAGQISAGKEYLLVVSNTAGWLAISTGQVVKILATGNEVGTGATGCRIAAKGPVVRLNGLAENFREDGVIEALANINMALSGNGVFIREALMGHNVVERQPLWVLEISRPLAEVPKALLESIAKRLQGEMELRHESYRVNVRQANLKLPLVHFVPMGSFAAATPQTPDFGHFDHSLDAGAVQRVVGAAWQTEQVALNTL